MKRLTLLMAAFAFILCSSGCGQSGPLYVPGNPTKMAVPPSQQPDDEEEKEDEEEDDSDSSKTE